MASAHSTSWAEADVTSPSRDRELAVSRMVLGSVIRVAVGIRATLPSGPGAWNRYDIQPIMAPRYSGPALGPRPGNVSQGGGIFSGHMRRSGTTWSTKESAR